MEVRDARVFFPGLDDKVFVEAATVSLAPARAAMLNPCEMLSTSAIVGGIRVSTHCDNDETNIERPADTRRAARPRRHAAACAR